MASSSGEAEGPEPANDVAPWAEGRGADTVQGPVEQKRKVRQTTWREQTQTWDRHQERQIKRPVMSGAVRPDYPRAIDREDHSEVL